MIRTMLRFDVREGGADDLLAVFRDRGILELSVEQPDCFSAEFCIAEDGSHVIVTATWEDEAAYARWTSRTDRGDNADAIDACLRNPMDPATKGVRYLVAHAPRPPAA
jgi:heme-degrading monooxygenase HmoA